MVGNYEMNRVSAYTAIYTTRLTGTVITPKETIPPETPHASNQK